MVKEEDKSFLTDFLSTDFLDRLETERDRPYDQKERKDCMKKKRAQTTTKNDDAFRCSRYVL